MLAGKLHFLFSAFVRLKVRAFISPPSPYLLWEVVRYENLIYNYISEANANRNHSLEIVEENSSSRSWVGSRTGDKYYTCVDCLSYLIHRNLQMECFFFIMVIRSHSDKGAFSYCSERYSSFSSAFHSEDNW